MIEYLLEKKMYVDFLCKKLAEEMKRNFLFRFLFETAR